MPRGANSRYNQAINYLAQNNILPPEYNQHVSLTEDEEFARAYPQLGGSIGDAINRLTSLGDQHRQGVTSAQRGADSARRRAGAGTGLAPEEMIQGADQLVARDRAGLSGMNYPVYRGQTTSPMSSLTQRARELRTSFGSRPRPYEAQIGSVLNRNNQGISQENAQGLLNNLSQGQRTFAQGARQALQNQFLSAYNPRVDRFNRRTERDITRTLPEASGTLNDTRRMSDVLEGSRSVQTARTLQDLQQNRETQREGLIGTLEQFGNQRHAYNNMVNQGERNRFQQEVNDPSSRLQMLESALSPHRGRLGEDSHPDLAQSQSNEILSALRAYGVDPSRPVGEWASSRTDTGRYPGQVVAPLPPSIQASHNIAERLSPNPRDNFRDRRRELTASLTGNETASSRALQNLTPAMQGRIGQLETQVQQRMRRDMGALNNEYIRLGQYGSPQHISASEERVRDLSRAALEERNNILQNSLREQLQLQHTGEMSNINQLDNLGRQSHSDYGNLLREMRNMNQTGANQFSNNQAENEELYRNYQNERLWEWPHMRNNVRAAALGEGQQQGQQQALGNVFRGLEDRNISLDNLARLNTNYSEMTRDRDRARTDLLSMQQARDALQSQLASSQQVAQQQAAQRQAEVARQQQIAQAQAVQQQSAAAEQRRLQTLQAFNQAEEAFLNYPGFVDPPSSSFSSGAQELGYALNGQRQRAMEAHEATRRAIHTNYERVGQAAIQANNHNLFIYPYSQPYRF